MYRAQAQRGLVRRKESDVQRYILVLAKSFADDCVVMSCGKVVARRKAPRRTPTAGVIALTTPAARSTFGKRSCGVRKTR
jgi:hypothetical protein